MQRRRLAPGRKLLGEITHIFHQCDVNVIVTSIEIILKIYSQVQRREAGSRSESDGSLHNHPGGLLFHLSVFFARISVFLFVYLYFYTILIYHQTHIFYLPLPSLSPPLTSVRVQSLLFMYFCQNTRLTVSMQIKTHFIHMAYKHIL